MIDDPASTLPAHVKGRNICAFCGHDGFERYEEDTESLDDLTPGRTYREGFPWYHFIRFRCERCENTDNIMLDVVKENAATARCHIRISAAKRQAYAPEARFGFIERLFDELEYIDGNPGKGRRYFRSPDTAAQAILKNAFHIFQVWDDLAAFEKYQTAMLAWGPPGQSDQSPISRLVSPAYREAVLCLLVAVPLATISPFPFGAASFRGPGFTGRFDNPGDTAVSISLFAVWILAWAAGTHVVLDMLRSLTSWVGGRK